MLVPRECQNEWRGRTGVAMELKAPSERSSELSVVQVGQRLREDCKISKDVWERIYGDEKGVTDSATLTVIFLPVETRVMSMYWPQREDSWPLLPFHHLYGLW